jgi:peptide/nickel transport system substrate-binding protein
MRWRALFCLILSLLPAPIGVRAQTPPAGGALTIADSIDLTSADPQVSNEIPIIYAYAEGLTSVGDDGQIKPLVSDSWDATPDATTYSFHLRGGVTFQNGRPLTADDVVWSLERIADPNTRAFRSNDLKNLTITAVDAQTVQITTPQPNAALPATLADCFIIAPESASAGGTVSQPIGTGPFAFQNWTPGQSLQLTRYDGYWRGAPAVEAITYTPLPDPTARLNALRSGAVDIAASISATDLPLLARDQTIATSRETPNIIGHLTFNMRSPQKPLDDVRVRRAVGLALNKRDLVTTAVGDGGPGQVNNQFWSEGDFWRLSVADPFATPDLDTARTLLQQAGVAGGFKTTLLTWSDGRPLAEVIQAELRGIGVDAAITYAPDFATYQRDLEQYGYGLLVDSAFPRADPLQWFTFWQSTNSNNLYRGGYANPKVDALLAAAAATPDADQRRQDYAQALQILENDDVASLIFLTRKGVWANSTRVQGFTAGAGPLNRADGGVASISLSE